MSTSSHLHQFYSVLYRKKLRHYSTIFFFKRWFLSWSHRKRHRDSWSRLGLAQNFKLSLVSDIEKSDSLVSVSSRSKNQRPLFLGLGLVVNFHKSNFSVSVSFQKIGLVPPWHKLIQYNSFHNPIRRKTNNNKFIRNQMNNK